MTPTSAPGNKAPRLGSSNVLMNRAYEDGSGLFAQPTVLHEIGHVLGLGVLAWWFPTTPEDRWIAAIEAADAEPVAPLPAPPPLPALSPGTGTVEIAGLTVPQALEIIRGLKGLPIVGGDLVEVSPPYDPTGNTALLGANLLYEMLCVLPGVASR